MIGCIVTFERIGKLLGISTRTKIVLSMTTRVLDLIDIVDSQTLIYAGIDQWHRLKIIAILLLV